MLHGHTRGVKSGIGEAISAAVQRDADILLFGHTHQPLEKYIPVEDSTEGEILKKPLRVFNPGSLGSGSFGLIDIRGKDVLMSHGSI
jgi:predicted phosphodiesterase